MMKDGSRSEVALELPGTVDGAAVLEPAPGLPPKRMSWLVDRLTGTAAERYGTIVFILLLGVYFTLASPGGRFLTWTNISSILSAVSVLGIVGAGLTVVLVIGAFDLSIAGNTALAGLVAASVAVNTGSVGLAVLVAVLVAGFVGVVNGLVVTRLGVPPFIGTLAMGLFILVGVQQTVAPNGTISDGLPESFGALGSERVFNFPVVTLLAIGVLIVVGFLMRSTTIGRQMHAIGGNVEAARLSGVRILSLQVAAFTICGLCCGLAGFLQASIFDVGSAETGSSILLDAFTACFIGASTLARGRFHIPGTAIGVLTLGMLTNGLTLAGWSNNSVPIAKGTLLIVAVAAASVMRRRRA